MARKKRKRSVPRSAKIAAALEFRRYRDSIRNNTLHRGGFNVGAPAKDGTSGKKQYEMYKQMWKEYDGKNYLKNLRRNYREGRYKKR